MMDEMSRTIDMMADALAKRTGRSPDDLAVRVSAGAVIGAIMAVMRPEAPESEGARRRARPSDRIDEALALLEPGLPL